MSFTSTSNPAGNPSGRGLVVTFPSVHQALKSEALLKPCGIDLHLVPVPRRISSSCGLAAEVKGMALGELQASLDENRIDFEGIYMLAMGKRPELLLEGQVSGR
ncbi:MAG: DUF3343 domain-containing protein [Clostridia bacterium]|nr:DUF3343 domain-containing protein [Clostridia bacterium]